MSIETSEKILNITGILSIIGGIIGIIFGALAIFGGGMAVTNAPSTEEEAMAVGGVAIIGGIAAIIAGIFNLLEGIFSVRAARDNSKIQPAWIFALISLVLDVLALISNIGSGKSLLSSIITALLSLLIFVAANNIKKSAY